MDLIKPLIQGFNELGHKHKQFLIFDADNQIYTNTQRFAREFKGRYFNLGNLNSSVIGFLAGIATAKTKVIFFDYGRKLLPHYQQEIEELICKIPLDVNFISLETHQQKILNQQLLPNGDLSIATKIKNLEVYTPSNEAETLRICQQIVNSSLPSYTKIVISPLPAPEIQTPQANLEPQVLSRGTDIGLISHGILTNYAFTATEKLTSNNHSIQLVHLPQLAPLSTKAITETVSACNQTFWLSIGETTTPPLNQGIKPLNIPPSFFTPQQNRDSISEFIYKQLAEN